MDSRYVLLTKLFENCKMEISDYKLEIIVH